jgi:cyclic pyranopterin phosphate synthase
MCYHRAARVPLLLLLPSPHASPSLPPHLQRPAKIDALAAAGVTHLNVSLDTLRADRFAEITRRPGAMSRKVLEAATYAAASGQFEKVKLNVVVMRGVNDDELADFAALARAGNNLDVRFIEWMPFDANAWNNEQMLPAAELVERLAAAGVPLARGTDGPNDTTMWWRHADDDGAKNFGRVGIIASMTTPFCGTCSRLRLLADGQLKTCLFSRDDQGEAEAPSLRDAMRGGASDADLAVLIGTAVGHKHAAYGGHASPAAISDSSNRPMVHIGG